eukprot:6210686-Pleurochrysis_carterae.AAC.1
MSRAVDARTVGESTVDKSRINVEMGLEHKKKEARWMVRTGVGIVAPRQFQGGRIHKNFFSAKAARAGKVGAALNAEAELSR